RPPLHRDAHPALYGPVGIFGGIHDAVAHDHRADEGRRTRDLDIVAVETCLCVTGLDDRVDHLQRLVGERVHVVVEHGHADGRTLIGLVDDVVVGTGQFTSGCRDRDGDVSTDRICLAV